MIIMNTIDCIRSLLRKKYKRNYRPKTINMSQMFYLKHLHTLQITSYLDTEFIYTQILLHFWSKR